MTQVGNCAVLVTKEIQIRTTQDLRLTGMVQPPNCRSSDVEKVIGSLEILLERLREDIAARIHSIN